MDDCASLPTCTLKVNLEGCEEYVVKLRKNLAKVDGVYGVDVDAEKGLVRVSGKVDPRKLIRKIEEKMKLKAKLLSYEDPIMNSENEDCMEMLNSNAIHVKKDHHDFNDHVPTKIYEDHKCKDSHCRFEHRKPINLMHGNHHMPTAKLHPPNPYRFPPAPPNMHHPRYYGRPLVPQYDHTDFGCRFRPSNPHRFYLPNDQWLPSTPLNLHHSRYYREPIVPQYYSGGYFHHDASVMWPLLQPLPPYEYCYYGARVVPARNNFSHFFSDENVTGCTVM